MVTGVTVHVARTLVRRLRQVNVAGEDKAKPLTIGIVAATPDVDLMNFCRLFAHALSRIDSTYHLNVPFIELDREIEQLLLRSAGDGRPPSKPRSRQPITTTR